MTMIRSAARMVLRHFALHSTFSMLNLAGLVVGISATLFLSVYVLQQVGMNRYHPDNERTFMILRDVELLDGGRLTGETSPGPLADYIQSSIPEVEAITQTGFGERLLVSNHHMNFYEYGSFAENSYFNVFHLAVIAGNPEQPFPNNNSIAISTKMARKLFDKEAPIGKILKISNQMEFQVSCVYEIPENSNIHEEFYMPFALHRMSEPSTWDDSNGYMYVRLKDANDKPAIESKLTGKIHEVWQSKKTTAMLFAVSDWHLHWDSYVQRRAQDRWTVVIAFITIGIFILLMACVNFINLATARAAVRGKEIGIRKMSGATHSSLIGQFLSESLVITLMATVLSLLVVWLTMPLFSHAIGYELSLFGDTRIIALTFSITLVVAFLAGGYPAFVLSSLKPATIMKGQLYLSIRGVGLRKALVVFQFSLAVILIFSAITMRQQLSYLRNISLGFDKRNVLYIEPGNDVEINTETFRNEVLKNHNVSFVAEASASPMEINGVALVEWDAGYGRQSTNFVNNSIDYAYIPTLGFEIVKGRNFSPLIASDSNAVIISESAADILGFEDPIGKTVFLDSPMQIVGVIKNFHNADIHSEGSPAIFFLGRGNFGFWRRIFVRYQPNSQQDVAAYVRQITNKMAPGYPMEVHFVDQDVDAQFDNDARTETIFIAFTMVALTIAGLGLFGLTLFITQRRTKEISIRKVLGATVPNLIALLSRFFLLPLSISLLIALPTASFLMEKFLSTYLFRTDVGVATFIITAIGISLLAFFTVGYQSARTALQDPVNNLKSE